jgi:hypothetical protein
VPVRLLRGSGTHLSKTGGVQIAPPGLFANEASICKPGYFVSTVPAGEH